MIEFIVGLSIVVGMIAILWLLGKLGDLLNITDGWDETFWDTVANGLVVMLLLAIVILVCVLLYFVGLLALS